MERKLSDDPYWPILIGLNIGVALTSLWNGLPETDSDSAWTTAYLVTFVFLGIRYIWKMKHEA